MPTWTPDELDPVNWAGIEPHYRAGVRSVSAIAKEFGVSRQAVDKHAKKNGWERDLRARVMSRAKEKVAAVAVAPPVAVAAVASPSTPAPSAEQIIGAASDGIAYVQLRHRTDISRALELVRRMIHELEQVMGADAVEFAAKLELVLSDPDEPKLMALEQAVGLIASLPQRAGVLGKLVDVLERLVALERQAFGLNRPDETGLMEVHIRDFTGRGDPDSPLPEARRTH